MVVAQEDVPGEERTKYDVIPEPPVTLGADQLTVDDWSPCDVAVTPLGEPGVVEGIAG